MTTETERDRAEFEAWWDDFTGRERRDQANYHLAAGAWQAAKASKAGSDDVQKWKNLALELGQKASARHADLKEALDKLICNAIETDKASEATCPHIITTDEGTSHCALAESSAQQAEAEAEPVAWMFQHEETGQTIIEDAQQIEWGFEKNNPRYQRICPLYAAAPAPVDREGLYGALKHGDDQHKMWLHEAIHAFFDGRDVPPPYPPAPVVPEAHNTRKVERTSDQSVTVTLASCRAASAFERAVTPKEGDHE